MIEISERSARHRTLVGLLRGRAGDRPDHGLYTFLADGEAEAGSLTPGELDRRARALAAWLQDAGCRGGRVLLLFPPGLDFIAAFFGCLYAGAVAVPAYPPRLHQADERLEEIFRDAAPRAVLTTSALLARLGEHRPGGAVRAAVDRIPDSLAESWREPDLGPDDLAFLQYTSGSTATPKGVMVTHGNLLDNAERIRLAFGQSEESVVVGWLPLYHDMGLIGNVLQPLWSGGRCVLMSPQAFLQRPVRWLEAISRYRATTSGGPNFAYDLCVRRVGSGQRAGLDLSSWQVAFNGAEPVRRSTLERFAEAFAGCGFRREAFVPCYGLAEATLLVTAGAGSFASDGSVGSDRSDGLSDGSVVEGPVSCGALPSGGEVRVADPGTGLAVAPGAVGEIWVSGPSVAAGYWNRPTETREAFGAMAGEEGPFLRTGDLGFVRQGELFVTGRIKDLIILRGRNHYPQDLERTAEQAHPALRPGGGAAFSADSGEEERLVIVHEIEPRARGREGLAEEVAAAVRRALAVEHEVGVHEVVLLAPGALPRTSSGKVRRQACRAAWQAGTLEVVGRSRSVGTEPAALEAWLRREVEKSGGEEGGEIDPDLPLVARGLDSLAAVELVHRIEAATGVELPHDVVLRGLSLRELAAEVLARREEVAGSGEAPPLVRGPRPAGGAPLSFGQQRLWFLHRMDPRSPTENLAGGYRLSGLLDLPALARALGEIVRRHEVLRTVYRQASAAEEPVQIVLPAAHFVLPLVDLAGLPAGAEEAEARRLAAEEADGPFDLTRGPVLRAVAVRLAPREHLLLATLHHIACDGWSAGVLLRELGALYGASTAGRPSPLPEPPLQVADFAVWQRRWQGGPVLAEQLAFWREKLAGAPPVLELPSDRPRPAVRSGRGARQRIVLPAATVARLAGLARSEGTTLYALLLALFQALLGRLSGEDDLVVGTPVAGRRQAETGGLIGFFVNTLALRAGLGGDPPLRAHLAQTRREVLDAFAHQDLPFERLVEELRPGRSLSHTPVFQVLFALQNAPGGPLELPGLRLSPLPAPPRARFDLELELAEERGVLAGALGFAVDLFDAATARRIAGHFETLLGGAAELPEARLSDLPLLSVMESRELAAISRGPALKTEAETVLALFAARAARTPEAEAVSGGGESLSYRELKERAGRTARRLAAQGAGPGTIVAVQAERSPDLAVALLGVLASGAAFLPLDPSLPAERAAFLLRDTGAILPNFDLSGETAPVVRRPGAGDLAYVIYTSGTTGVPKGVMVQHGSLLHTLSALLAAFSFAPGERMLAIAPFSFDIFLVELLAPLLSGGSVRLLPLAPGLDLDLLLAELEGAARLHAVPAVLRQIVDRVPPGAARFAGLREVFTGGDLVPPELPGEARKAFPAARVAVLYGPTEGTIVCAAQPEAGSAPRPLLGHPLPGTVLELRDRHGSLVPPGAIGEVHLGGPGVALGYLGRPERTAERFVPAPGGSRFYRTGDLARRRLDGTLEFLGRADRQVKIRGVRVEPGEIEARLAGHRQVREAAVVAMDFSGERRLAAFFVPAGEKPVPAELRAHLARTLPSPMIPAAFVALADLPRTPSGKVDRRALAVWSIAPEDAGAAAARTQEEEIVAGLWSELLGVERVGMHEDVFASGAHSLLVTRMAWRLRETFGVELPLRVLFEEPTPAGLARRIAAARMEAGALPPLRPFPRGEDLPLSFAQQRLWFEDQMEPGSPLYNMAAMLGLRGPLDAAALTSAFTEIVRRHETLRTTFRATRGRPRQVIAPPSPFRLPRVDLTGLPVERREEEAGRQGRAEARRPFDLAAGPLLRGFLIRLDSAEHRLVLDMHHIVSDGWSTAVLVEEVGALYGAYAAGRLSPLPELPIQYADFALWQREQLAGAVLEAQLAAWRERLAGAPPALELPTDRPRPAVRGTRGAEVPLHLSADLADRLARLGRREGATLFMTLLAAFQALLHRETGAGDLAVGTPAAGRSRSETEGLIGFFVNTLVVRTNLGGSPGFRALVSRVREAVLGASAHQDLPFERLVEELVPQRDPARTPLVQVLFALEEKGPEAAGLAGLEMTPTRLPSGTAKSDLSVTLTRGPAGLGGSIEYSTDLFDRTTIQRFARRFERFVREAVEEPETSVDALPLLAAEERHQVAVEWAADTRVAYPRERCIHDLFEEQAAATPDLPAVSAGDLRLTYAELNARADRLAHHLVACGVGPESLVAVLLDRSPELIVTFLAILKAGGAYVPLDPAYPVERLAFMLRDSGARTLVAGELPAGLAVGEARVVSPKDIKDGKDFNDGHPMSLASLKSLVSFPEMLAYLLYTSGSTGTPKGVAVPHRGVVRLVCGGGYVRLGPGERVAQTSNASFDAATFEIWGALLHGAELVLAPAHRTSLEELGDFLERERISVLSLTSGLFHQMVDGPLHQLAAVRQILAGGEVVSPAHVRKLVAALPGPDHRVVCCYGPTENTTFTSTYPVATPDQVRAPLPIGRPIGSTGVWVLDLLGEEPRPAPLGVAGELVTGGDGLARGYLGRPGLTAERFVPDPFGPPGGRLYRTGDRARWLADGTVDFLGRLDGQIKLRGFRIEPGEIEAAAEACPGVEQAVVLLGEGRSDGSVGSDRSVRSPGDRRLVAYLVPAEGSARDTAAVRAFLRNRLPDHMVPAAFVWLDALPLTENGKVDRRALARVEAPAEPGQGGGAEPRTPIEEGISGIWREVLGVVSAGPADDFFELGGHSLLATQVVSRVREAFGVELPLRDLFARPRLADLAAHVEEERRRGAGLVAPPITPVSRDAFAEGLPLSFGQEWMWVAGELNPEAAAYNAPLAVRLHGRLDFAMLAAALREVVRRHEVLRTRFEFSQAGPLQVPDASLRLPFAVVDLGALPASLQERETLRLALAEAARPFELAAGPPARALLVRLDEAEHLLLLGLHHLVTDGWSAGVLLREVAALYGGVSLPELPVQYGDYAVWQRRWIAGETLETLTGWWREHLAGPPPFLDLPVDRPGAAAPGGLGERLPFRPDPAQVEALRALARGRGSTLFAVLLAAWTTLLARFTRQDDLVVGTPVANRTRRELEGLIGYFVNDVPLRTRLGGDPAFPELLDRVHEAALGAWAHQDLPLQKIVQEVGGGAPLFRTWFQLQNMRLPDLELPGGVKLSLEELDVPAATFDLELLAREGEGGLAGFLVYNRELFHRGTAESLLHSFQALLAGIAADPARRLSDLPLLTAEERGAVLQGTAPAGSCHGATTLHRAFEAVAAARPQGTAVTCEGESLTYAELNRRADILARRLRAQGVGPESRVGLRLERSLELVIGILGVLKSGGAYVPLDPDYPRERLELLLEDAGLQVLVAREESVFTITKIGPLRKVEGETGPDHLAYVIYTSGSTGRPKGVMVTHRQAARLFEATRGFGFGPEDVWTLFHSYAFDFSVWEIWGALLHGGRLVVVPHRVSRSPEDFLDLLAAEKVTVLNQTPSAFYQLLRAEEARPEAEDAAPLSLRQVIFGGEALEPSRLLPWIGRHGDAQPALVNMYGITETTVHVTVRPLTRADAESADSVLGRPLDDLRVALLDAALRPVPAGAVGEICVGGGGVARGYLGRPDLTGERFVPDPFCGETGEPGARLYRSGDLARLRADGELVYLGRADRQLKVRGFRIEPGEVEAALVRHPGVAQAAVFARRLSAEDVRLAACFVPRPPAAPTSAELRDHLLALLPEPWVPGLFVPVPALPLTAHGKVDRQALAALADLTDLTDRSDGAAPATAAPLSPLEEHLATLWAGLLAVDHVGRDDNFFTLGGHSLLVTWIAARVREAFGIPPPMRSFFEKPTVGNLALGVLVELAGKLEPGRFEELFAFVEDLPEAEVERLVAEKRGGAVPARPSPPAPLPRAGEGWRLADSTGAEDAGLTHTPLPLAGEGPGVRALHVRDLLDLLPPPGPPEPPLRVTTMAFPTANRPAVLERGLASHAEAAREHGRTLRFAVLDDSPDPSVGAEYRRRLADLRRRYGVEISYAGPEEKRRFAAALCAEGLPPEGVAAALLDPEGIGLPIGANRNAVLLQTVGEGVVSVDDDTLARGGPPPEPEPGVEFLTGSVPELAFLSAREPGSIRGFTSRAEAMAAVDLRVVDLAGVHEGLLGRDASAWLRDFDPAAPAVVDRADPAFLRSLESGGRVVVTTNGWVGDCGWRSPIFYMLQTGDSWRHLVRSADFYRAVTASKEIVRFLPRPAVGNAESFMATMFCGFDNRGLLPPFPPVLWGEDMLYGLTLQLTFPAARAGHLPWVALHDPIEQRGFWPGEMVRTASGIDHSRLVSALLADFEPDFRLAPADALRRLGAFFQELGRMEPGAFDELARRKVRDRAEAFAAGLEARLAEWQEQAERPEAGELWATDVRRYRDLLRRHAAEPDFALPLDLLYHREPEEARRLAQRLLVHHGRALAVWPDLMEAVRGLKARGRRLAEVVP